MISVWGVRWSELNHFFLPFLSPIFTVFLLTLLACSPPKPMIDSKMPAQLKLVFPCYLLAMRRVLLGKHRLQQVRYSCLQPPDTSEEALASGTQAVCCKPMPLLLPRPLSGKKMARAARVGTGLDSGSNFNLDPKP
jgi:hypothetical protein